jgi:hypothetical protein
VSAGRIPLRTGGPSASFRPRAPCYGHESRRCHHQAGQPYLNATIFPLCAPPAPPPSIAAAGELAAPLAPAAGDRPISPLGPVELPQVTYCHPCSPPRRNPELPRQPPSATDEPPRRQLLRPSQDLQPTLGELALDPEQFPGREHRRSCRISGEPAVPWIEGPNCTV